MSKPGKWIGFLKNPAIQSISIYTFTNFFGKAASFLLLFIFTNPVYISPSENGLLSLFSTGILFLMPFLGMGLLQSASTDFFKMEKKEFRDFFTTAFVMAFVVMILSCIVLFFFSGFLKNTYGYPIDFCWLIPVITFLTFCNEQFLSLVRNNDQPGIYFKANTLKILLELGISVVLVVFFAWRWGGRIAGIFAAYIVTGVYAFSYFYKHNYLFGRIIKSVVKTELIYAVPIITMQVSMFCMSASDKFFLSGLTSDNNETVGIYSIASVFASIILVLSSALMQYVFPKIYAQLSLPEADYSVIQKLFRLYCGIMIGGTIVIGLMTPLAYRYFINEKYSPALSYIYILFAGYFTWTIVNFFYSFLLFFKAKRKILVLSLFGIAASLSMNYFLIKKWSATGAAWSTLIVYLAVLIVALYLTKNYWRKLSTKKSMA